ncbi:uncharacterized protein LOC132756914 [Ruditapes philippinarum]|uniref:uncharacterized protein LOC132756914 n=1 Tax=Ruditapes philippinarum TaxID=129788 RepID=UPI00295A866D|nr:uncharacterized protein LOC132756914 [Ruditapes philippinarum]
MYNKTILDRVLETKDDLLNLPRNRMLEIGASVLFLFMITQGRRTWLNILNFSLFLEAINYTLFPQNLGFWVHGELDETHLLLTRFLGLLCITWTFGYFVLSKSTDSTTETSYLLGYTVMLVSSLMAKGYLMTHPSKKSAVKIESDDMNSIFFITLLFAVGSLFFTVKSNDWGGFGEQQSHANFHLRLQFVLLLVMGILFYTMPSWTVKMMSMNVEKVDTVHAFLARANGTMLLGMAIVANRAANFLRPAEKDILVFSQWLFFVLFSLLGWIDTAGRWATLPWSRVAIQATHDAVIILNATGALNRDFSVVKRSVIPRFKAVPQDVRNLFKFKKM